MRVSELAIIAEFAFATSSPSVTYLGRCAARSSGRCSRGAGSSGEVVTESTVTAKGALATISQGIAYLSISSSTASGFTADVQESTVVTELTSAILFE